MTAPIATDRDLEIALAAFRTSARTLVLRTSRYRMRYFTWGSGPPLVLIHGMADAARAFVMVMHQLAAKHTCIAYELPDGVTDGSVLAHYTHKEYSEDLLELLDHLDLARTNILGSSFGSTVVLSALAREPRRFTSGILQGGFAHRPLNFAQRYLCRAARHWPGWFADWPMMFRRVLRRIEPPTIDMLPPQVREYLLANGALTTFQAAAMRSLLIDRLDLRPLLPSIQVPVLMIGGDQDSIVPRPCELEVQQSLPRVERIEFSGCGHYPQYTHPIPMARAIERFLATAHS